MAVYAHAATPSNEPISSSQCMVQGLEAPLKGFDDLSEAEKQKLLEIDQKTEPYYAKMEQVEKEIERIEAPFWDDAEGLFAQWDQVFEANIGLWDKLCDNATAEQELMENLMGFIRASQVLTDDEKEILLKDQQKADAIEKQLDEKAEAAYKATEDLHNQVDKLYEEIENIYDIDPECDAIWEKIEAFDFE
ncbi:hypothetical protein [Anaerotignum sp.]|uniref:hypothetical protein n=1 Tax=Anaerotignum sp. TaxID=2039241 RepID=UPI0028A971F6|nr:hypothetical protein [Anaerotignum sp.]